MRTFKSKEEASAFAQMKSRNTGSDYRIVEIGNRFVVATEGKISFYYPESFGWNVRAQY